MSGTAPPLRVLIVEDDEDDFLITQDMLHSQQRVRCELDWCSDYEGALREIRAARHDVYLVDYRLGEHTGLELIRAAFTGQPPAPVILLTGQQDYEIDLQATTLGVTDFLVKQELGPALLERSIRYSRSHHRAMTDLARSEERYSLAVRAANDGIWDWDLARDRIYLSTRWRAILGGPEDSQDEPPAAWFDLVHNDDLEPLHAAIRAHISKRSQNLEIELRMRHRNGSWRWVLVRGLATRDAQGQATRLAGSLSDITERRTAEHQLRHDALHDTLTALPNRALFMDRLDQVLQRAARDPTVTCAVLFVDIDNFKDVNDRLSHSVGDRLLIAIADRLARLLRPGDTIARFAGDEFTVLLEDVDDATAARIIAQRLHQGLERAFRVSGHDLAITASIGISLNIPGINAADLLRNSDIAMYHAKAHGTSHSVVFDDGMHTRIVTRLTRETDLRRALEESLLGVYYQPIVDLTSGRVRGLEALVRWPETWAFVAPLDFIAIAEQTGLIRPLGQHVLRTALHTLADWRRAGVVEDDVQMSVNLSGRQLDDPTLLDQLRDAIANAGVPPRVLLLEITESTLMQNLERTQAMISEIASIGIGLHLDDYGTGYSSLSALHHYAVDALKIDRSFIAAINEKTANSEVIVRSTVTLAHNLGMSVVAEGIEDAAQLQRLKGFGCDHGQGYLFSKPLSRQNTETLLSNWASTWGTGSAKNAEQWRETSPA
jgi:diguanylate cyclase (GGDEF)-like protein/PAS domain S-box-containing protein